MSEIYQPLIIEHLLENNGKATKRDLAILLSISDSSLIEYYSKVLMNWPYKTLSKHKIINYDKKKQEFTLNTHLNDSLLINIIRSKCKSKIKEWLSNKKKELKQSQSIRYEVLSESNQKCALCGIDSSISNIDIDHIVPKSRADKNGNIIKDGIKMNVNDKRNLQALCYVCNRGKRNLDDQDFRKSSKKLVRDKVPELILQTVTCPHFQYQWIS
ncbi:HNH endonuclease [Leptospira yanagawae]|nr:HNH endonuclease [Leptospira yanagawae]